MLRWGINVTEFCFFRAKNKGVKEEKRTIKVDCCYDISWNLGLKRVFFPVAPGYSSCPQYKGLRQAGSSLALLFPSFLTTMPPCLDSFVHLLSFDSASCTTACPPTQGHGQHFLVAPSSPPPSLLWPCHLDDCKQIMGQDLRFVWPSQHCFMPLPQVGSSCTWAQNKAHAVLSAQSCLSLNSPPQWTLIHMCPVRLAAGWASQGYWLKRWGRGGN